jgi:hypothetical protein
MSTVSDFRQVAKKICFQKRPIEKGKRWSKHANPEDAAENPSQASRLKLTEATGLFLKVLVATRTDAAI